jgi:Zn-dependent membrane protease YugP
VRTLVYLCIGAFCFAFWMFVSGISFAAPVLAGWGLSLMASVVVLGIFAMRYDDDDTRPAT